MTIKTLIRHSKYATKPMAVIYSMASLLLSTRVHMLAKETLLWIP